MKSGGDPNVGGVRPRREVMIDDQPGTSETIPASPEAAFSRQQADYFTIAEPEVASPPPSDPPRTSWRTRIKNALFGVWLRASYPIKLLAYKAGLLKPERGLAVSSYFIDDEPDNRSVPTVGNDSITVTTSPVYASGAAGVTILNARNPYDLAGLLQSIEYEFTGKHRLGEFVDILTTFPQQPSTIGKDWRVTPSYNSLTQFSVGLEPLNNEIPMAMIHKATSDFESQRYREIVERVDTADSDPSLGEMLFSLLILKNILAAESRRIADMLHIDVNSNDPRLNQLRSVGQLFAGSLPSNLAVRGAVRILEIGIRQNRQGEYNAIAVRFAKGGTALRDIVTWVGKIQPTGKIIWHYDEVVNDPVQVTNATSPAFLTTKEIVKYLVPVANWENVRYSVRLESGADAGGRTPQGPAAPASSATPSTVTGLVEAEGEVSSGGHQGSAERHAGLAVRMAHSVYRHLPQNPWAAVQRRFAVAPFAARMPVPVSIRH